MDKQRVNLQAKIREMEKEFSRRAEVRVKLEDEIKELNNLVEELKADAIEKDTRLDHLQKRSDKLYTLLGETKATAIKEFKVSSEFIDLLDRNYAAGFEDFRMDAIEHFSKVDFSPIKLHVVVESSLLQTSSEDINVEDDDSTQPAKDNPKFGDIAFNGL